MNTSACDNQIGENAERSFQAYFSEKALRKLAESRAEINGRYQRLLMDYVSLRLRDKRAREYASHGFPRRLRIMARCIHNVFTTLPPGRVNIPSFDELGDATINIQSFVFNAFGSLDNLAWIWIYETKLKTEDGKPVPKGWVGLAAKNKLIRNSLPNDLQEYLKTLDTWFDQMVTFRHALAHRIPLYIPPYAVRPQDGDTYRDLEQRKMAAVFRGDIDEHDRLSAKQLKLAFFRPFMQHSYEEGAVPLVFHAQLIADFKTVYEVGSKFLSELKHITS
jgi:hypothetical protein